MTRILFEEPLRPILREAMALKAMVSTGLVVSMGGPSTRSPSNGNLIRSGASMPIEFRSILLYPMFSLYNRSGNPTKAPEEERCAQDRLTT